jgi:hypothetical protein
VYREENVLKQIIVQEGLAKPVKHVRMICCLLPTVVASSSVLLTKQRSLRTHPTIHLQAGPYSDMKSFTTVAVATVAVLFLQLTSVTAEHVSADAD